jgi:WD40 repeat protein
MPQYWVIDAVDECVKYSDLFTLLKDLQSCFPFQIFMTSRKLPDMSRLTRLLEGCDTSIVQIPIDDTKRDIELYVCSRIMDLPIDEEEEREELAQQILTKADTSFLWVRLVMDELEGVYGYDTIMQVLQGIPEGMFLYYARAVAEMGKKKRELHVAKAILLWVMLATRPLSIAELSHALQLDINVHLPSAKSAIEGLCGQLVSVDVHTGLVQPLHATAREFILSEEAGEFQVLKTQGHEKIALTCLRLLVGSEMQPPRNRRLLDQKQAKPLTSVLGDYAITQFSEHAFSASTESDQLLLALERFLKTTVLTWIEKIMAKNEAHRLIRTAKNLKAYLDLRAKYHSPPNHHVNNIEVWATDLNRVVSSFGRALISSPQSVYFLVPPLCPTQSAIFRQFGQPSDGLILSGYRQSDWSDCVANIHFEDETAAAIGCGNTLIAIGTESGKVDMYNSRSFQKEKTIKSSFSVDLIRFDPYGSFVAVCNRRFVEVWNIDGTPRWKTRTKSRCILLSSSQDVLIGVAQQGRSFQWNINTGELLHGQSYNYQAPDFDIHAETSAGKAPSYASLSPGLELLALAYRNCPVCIFDFSSGTLIGWAVDDNHRATEQLIFNPNPDVNLLLVAYNESHLALYDPWSGTLIESVEAERHAILTSITCSPDGRTFAAMDILGHLRIWDFESLTLLYHVLTPSRSFSLLQFTSDGLGLVHVVDHDMRIWVPSALVRKTVEEEVSLSNRSPVTTVAEGQFERFQSSKIKTLIAHPLWPILFAGNYHGDVLVYQASNNYEPSTLYSHSEVIVRCLATSKSNIIASADIHANVQVWQLDISLPKPVQIVELVLQARFNAPIRQLLFDASGMYLLVSTIESDHVYSVEGRNCVGSIDFQACGRLVWKWFVVPELNYLEYFLLMVDHSIVAYSVKNLSATPKAICEVSDGFMEAGIDSITHLPDTLCIVVEIQRPQSHTLTSVFTLPRWSSPAHEIITRPTSAFPSELCAQFLGVDQSSKRLVLLQPESWVCSVDLRELEARRYMQHFFVPEEYGSFNADVRPIQTFDGDFAFCLYDKVVVVKNRLKFQTQRALK